MNHREAELQEILHAAQGIHQQEQSALHQQLENQRVAFEQQLNHRETELQQRQHAAKITHDQELEDLRESLKSQRAGFEADLAQARQSSEQLGQQLQAIHEELEHYYLQASAGRQLVESQQNELIRAQRILSRLHPSPDTVPPQRGALNVEVLPAMEIGSATPSLQAEALLRAYADNLKRAGVLLERLARP